MDSTQAIINAGSIRTETGNVIMGNVTNVVNYPVSSIGTVFDLPETRNYRFVGREDVLEKITSVFNDVNDANDANDANTGRSSRVAITGLGGMGKTQVALEYCYRNSKNYPYIFWVHSESETSVHSSYRNIASLLNLSISSTDDPVTIIKKANQWFRDNGRWLLVFDNADDNPIRIFPNICQREHNRDHPK